MSFEHRLIDLEWRDFPSNDDLDARRVAGDFAGWAMVEDDRFEHDAGRSHVLLLEGVNGDFADVRVAGEIGYTSEGMQRYYNRGCLLTLRSGAGASGATTPEAELARLGVTLQQPFLYWHGIGVLHATSTPLLFALFERGDAGMRLTSLFRASDATRSFESHDCVRVEEFEAIADGTVGYEMDHGGSAWHGRFEGAAAADIEVAARALARVAATRAERADAALAACADCPADAPPERRRQVVAGFAAAIQSRALRARMADALRIEYAKLVAAYERAGEEAERARDDGATAGLAWLRARPFRTDASEMPIELDGQGWALAWIERARGRSPLERLRLHAELVHEQPGNELVKPFREHMRLALASEFDAHGRAAANGQLHATATGQHLIACYLRADASPFLSIDNFCDVLTASAEEAPNALQLARRQGVELLKRCFPFVALPQQSSLYRWSWGVPDEYTVEGTAPLFSPEVLRLWAGRFEQQEAFASLFDLPLLRVTVGPAKLGEVSVTTTKEERTVEIGEHKTRSNDAAVDAWLGARNALAGRIDALDRQIAGARGDSVLVSGTETRQTALFGDVSTFTLTSTYESMASAVARVQAMGRVEQLTEERDRLRAQLSSLETRPPSRTIGEIAKRNVTLTTAVQHWTITYTNEVRLEGGAEPMNVTIETKTLRHLARNTAAPELGVEARDEWTTVERMRQDPQITADGSPDVVEAALRACFAMRVEALRGELRTRDLTEAERTTELAWLDWLVTPTTSPRDLERPGPGQLLAFASAHW
ncbi:MAG: hypothetical protein IT455_17490 [Planctomycetes bacterium]|nr:hypothetical protein [Planctomycetota bacterium]